MNSPSFDDAPALTVEPSDAVHHVVDNGVLAVTIDRPEKRNPLSLGVLERIRMIFTEHQHVDLRVAWLGGAGDKAFASGGDLNELAVYRTKAEAAAFSRHGKAALNAIRAFAVPVVARVNGVALGGGAELALACDLRFAAPHARIGFIHGRLKIAPSWGGGHDLMRLVGPAKALQLMAEAPILSAAEALETGLFDATCPAENDFDSWFEARLRTLAQNPPQVMRAYKAAAGRLVAREAGDAAETQHFADVWVHDDHWSAVDEIQGSRK